MFPSPGMRFLLFLAKLFRCEALSHILHAIHLAILRPIRGNVSHVSPSAGERATPRGRITAGGGCRSAARRGHLPAGGSWVVRHPRGRPGRLGDPGWDWNVLTSTSGPRASAAWRQDVIGRNLWATFPQWLGTSIETHSRRALAEQVVASFEVQEPISGHWQEVNVTPCPRASSSPGATSPTAGAGGGAAGSEGGRRGGEPGEGPVPRDALARAAHAAGPRAHGASAARPTPRRPPNCCTPSRSSATACSFRPASSTTSSM